MWIKSQNKHKLLNIKAFQVIEGLIEGFSDDGEGWTLGEYANEERALEVLNQIEQRLIRGCEHDDMTGNRRTQKQFVFQMPEFE